MLALLVFGRHIASEPDLMSLLCNHILEETAITVLAAQLPSLDKASLKRLSAQLEALPPGGSLSAGIRRQKEATIMWLINLLKHPDKQMTLEIPAQVGKEGQMESFVEKARKMDPLPLQKALEGLTELASYYDEVDKLLTLPLGESSAQLSRLQQRVNRNAFHMLFLPHLEERVRTDDYANVRVALFKAAVAVAREGPNALRDFHDPAGGGSFSYKALQGGFELASGLREKGKPVTLRIEPGR
jgi:hypothetical protein